MNDEWAAPEGDPIPFEPPVEIDVSRSPRRKRRRVAPIVPTTIALAALTLVGGVAALNRAGARPMNAEPVVSSLVAATTVAADPGTTVAVVSGGATTASVTSAAAPSAVPAATGTTSATPPPAPTTAAAPALAKAMPPGGLYDGVRPPQFVLVSFDGAADQCTGRHVLRGSMDVDAVRVRIPSASAWLVQRSLVGR